MQVDTLSGDLYGAIEVPCDTEVGLVTQDTWLNDNGLGVDTNLEDEVRETSEEVEVPVIEKISVGRGIGQDERKSKDNIINWDFVTYALLVTCD